MVSISQLLREPMLHFFVLAAGIFLWYGYAGDGRAAPDEILVSAGQVDRLR